MKSLLVLFTLALAIPAAATDRDRDPPPRPIVVVETHHDGAAYAIAGAAVAWWLTHRYHKRHPERSRAHPRTAPQPG